MADGDISVQDLAASSEASNKCGDSRLIPISEVPDDHLALKQVNIKSVYECSEENNSGIHCNNEENIHINFSGLNELSLPDKDAKDLPVVRNTEEGNKPGNLSDCSLQEQINSEKIEIQQLNVEILETDNITNFHGDLKQYINNCTFENNSNDSLVSQQNSDINNKSEFIADVSSNNDSHDDGIQRVNLETLISRDTETCIEYSSEGVNNDLIQENSACSVPVDDVNSVTQINSFDDDLSEESSEGQRNVKEKLKVGSIKKKFGSHISERELVEEKLEDTNNSDFSSRYEKGDFKEEQNHFDVTTDQFDEQQVTGNTDQNVIPRGVGTSSLMSDLVVKKTSGKDLHTSELIISNPSNLVEKGCIKDSNELFNPKDIAQTNNIILKSTQPNNMECLEPVPSDKTFIDNNLEHYDVGSSENNILIQKDTQSNMQYIECSGEKSSKESVGCAMQDSVVETDSLENDSCVSQGGSSGNVTSCQSVASDCLPQILLQQLHTNVNIAPQIICNKIQNVQFLPVQNIQLDQSHSVQAHLLNQSQYQIQETDSDNTVQQIQLNLNTHQAQAEIERINEQENDVVEIEEDKDVIPINNTAEITSMPQLNNLQVSQPQVQHGIVYPVRVQQMMIGPSPVQQIQVMPNRIQQVKISGCNIQQLQLLATPNIQARQGEVKQVFVHSTDLRNLQILQPVQVKLCHGTQDQAQSIQQQNEHISEEISHTSSAQQHQLIQASSSSVANKRLVKRKLPAVNSCRKKASINISGSAQKKSCPVEKPSSYVPETPLILPDGSVIDLANVKEAVLSRKEDTTLSIADSSKILRADAHPSKSPDMLEVHPSKSPDRPEVHPSKISDRPEVHPTKISDRPEVHPTKISDRPEVHSSKVSDRLEVHQSEVSDRPEVHQSKVSDRPEVHPNKLSDKTEAHPSTSSDKTEAHPSTSSDRPDAHLGKSSGRCDTHPNKPSEKAKCNNNAERTDNKPKNTKSTLFETKPEDLEEEEERLNQFEPSNGISEDIHELFLRHIKEYYEQFEENEVLLKPVGVIVRDGKQKTKDEVLKIIFNINIDCQKFAVLMVFRSQTKANNSNPCTHFVQHLQNGDPKKNGTITRHSETDLMCYDVIDLENFKVVAFCLPNALVLPKRTGSPKRKNPNPVMLNVYWDPKALNLKRKQVTVDKQKVARVRRQRPQARVLQVDNDIDDMEECQVMNRTAVGDYLLYDNDGLEGYPLPPHCLKVGSYDLSDISGRIWVTERAVIIGADSNEGYINLKIIPDDIVQCFIYFGQQFSMIILDVNRKKGMELRERLNIPEPETVFDERMKFRVSVTPVGLLNRTLKNCISTLLKDKYYKLKKHQAQGLVNIMLGEENTDAEAMLEKSLPRVLNSCISETVNIIDDDEDEEDVNDDTEDIGRKKTMQTSIQTIYKYKDAALNANDLRCLRYGVWVNDAIISLYLRYYEHELLNKEERNSVHFLTSFFYERLTKRPGYPKVESTPFEYDPTLSESEIRYLRVHRWFKTVDILEKDFIIIPINFSSHWFLVVVAYANMLCEEIVRRHGEKETEKTKGKGKKKFKITNARDYLKKKSVPVTPKNWPTKSEIDQADPNEESTIYNMSIPAWEDFKEKGEQSTVTSETLIKRPRILVFDSLGKPYYGTRNTFIATIRDFIAEEFRCKYNFPMGASKFWLKGVHVEVPQQDNGNDCGLYLLHNVEKFFEVPIRDYRLPICSLKTWYDIEEIKTKRAEIWDLIMHLMYEDGGIDVPNLKLPLVNVLRTGKVVNPSRRFTRKWDSLVKTTGFIRSPSEIQHVVGQKYIFNDSVDYVIEEIPLRKSNNNNVAQNTISPEEHTRKERIRVNRKKISKRCKEIVLDEEMEIEDERMEIEDHDELAVEKDVKMKEGKKVALEEEIVVIDDGDEVIAEQEHVVVVVEEEELTVEEEKSAVLEEQKDTAVGKEEEVMVVEENEVAVKAMKHVVPEYKDVVVEENKKIVIEQIEDATVEGKAPPVVEEKDLPVVSEKDSSVVGDEDPSVVGDEDPSVVGDEDPSVVEEKDPPIVEKEDPPVVEEEDPPVVKEGDSPIVEEGKLSKVVGEEDPTLLREENFTVVGEKNPEVVGKEDDFVEENNDTVVEDSVTKDVEDSVADEEEDSVIEDENDAEVKDEDIAEEKKENHTVEKEGGVAVENSAIGKIIPEKEIDQIFNSSDNDSTPLLPENAPESSNLLTLDMTVENAQRVERLKQLTSDVMLHNIFSCNDFYSVSKNEKITPSHLHESGIHANNSIPFYTGNKFLGVSNYIPYYPEEDVEFPVMNNVRYVNPGMKNFQQASITNINADMPIITYDNVLQNSVYQPIAHSFQCDCEVYDDDDITFYGRNQLARIPKYMPHYSEQYTNYSDDDVDLFQPASETDISAAIAIMLQRIILQISKFHPSSHLFEYDSKNYAHDDDEYCGVKELAEFPSCRAYHPEDYYQYPEDDYQYLECNDQYPYDEVEYPVDFVQYSEEENICHPEKYIQLPEDACSLEENVKYSEGIQCPEEDVQCPVNNVKHMKPDMNLPEQAGNINMDTNTSTNSINVESKIVQPSANTIPESDPINCLGHNEILIRKEEFVRNVDLINSNSPVHTTCKTTTSAENPHVVVSGIVSCVSPHGYFLKNPKFKLGDSFMEITDITSPKIVDAHTSQILAGLENKHEENSTGVEKSETNMNQQHGEVTSPEEFDLPSHSFGKRRCISNIQKELVNETDETDEVGQPLFKVMKYSNGNNINT